jgi:tetratricopeptide (TPR) repeat protein
MRRIFLLCIVLACAQVQAQNIILKDGRIIPGSDYRRTGDTVTVKAQMGATAGDVGFPVSSITKIEFPEPAELSAATDLLLQGKAAEALVKIEPVLKAQAAFKDIPGSWWAKAAQVKLTALAATHGDADADALIKEMLNTKADPEVVLYAKVRDAASLARKGSKKQAIEVCDAVIKDSKRKETLADAWCTKGLTQLSLHDFDSALMSLLHIPIFYPDQKLLMPRVLAGCAYAYTSLEDYVNAKSSLEELIKTYPGSTEAIPAKADLAKVDQKLSKKPPTNP